MNHAKANPWITPSWPAPAHIRACSTTRAKGVSTGPYEGLNLGDAVGDEALAVAKNRQLLITTLALKQPPLWLSQQHGNRVVSASAHQPGIGADGCVSQCPDQVCVVLGADCLPVLLCDRAGTRVAAAHAGWRGLAAGILEATVSRLDIKPDELLAWLGPAIGDQAYIVGEEVRAAFMAQDDAAVTAFRSAKGSGWHADLYQLARQRLWASGVTSIHGGEHCTYRDSNRFYSFRRDGVSGRMASLIWITSPVD